MSWSRPRSEMPPRPAPLERRGIRTYSGMGIAHRPRPAPVGMAHPTDIEVLMATAARGMAKGLGRTAGLIATAIAMSLSPAAGQDMPTVRLDEFEINLGGATGMLLIHLEPVQRELKMPDAQKKELKAVVEEQRRKLWELMRPGQRVDPDREKRRAVLAQQTRAAVLALLTPDQRERLIQIELQARGPRAFAPDERRPPASDDRPLPEQLGMTADQVRRARAIVKEGEGAIEEAATFTVPLVPAGRLPTITTLQKVLESPEYDAAKQAARRAVLAARARAIGRIEDEVLTEAQRATYRKRLGPPFDLTRLVQAPDDRWEDFSRVADVLGLRGIERVDLDYQAKVPRPAYTGAVPRPRVLFDEAHHNQYPALGAYMPLSDLLRSDGYRVIRNRRKFTGDMLRQGDLLIVAGAAGAAAGRRRGAEDPAFTDAECDAVRDCVKDGGALLLVVDVPPSGAAAQSLAGRFGVELSNRVTSDPANMEGQRPPLIFSRRNDLLGDHPITRGRDDSERLERVGTFGGQSLKGPEGSVPILKLADTAVDRINPDNRLVSAAGRAQGLAFTFGKGRVVVLGEADAIAAERWGPRGQAILTGMNVPGLDNRQMALNILHWLSGLFEPRESSPNTRTH
jgi:hypothetical protein